MHTFETPEPHHPRWSAPPPATSPSTTDDTDRTTVELTPLNAAGEDAVAKARVEQQGSKVVVDFPRHHGGLFRQSPSVGVASPVRTAASLEVKTGSADIRATGTCASTRGHHGIRRHRARHVTGSAKLKSGSGAVSAGRVDQALVATAGSGDISIGELAGDAVTKTGSGDVEVGRLGGTLQTKSGSGSLTVRRATSGWSGPTAPAATSASASRRAPRPGSTCPPSAAG